MLHIPRSQVHYQNDITATTWDGLFQIDEKYYLDQNRVIFLFRIVYREVSSTIKKKGQQYIHQYFAEQNKKPCTLRLFWSRTRCMIGTSHLQLHNALDNLSTFFAFVCVFHINHDICSLSFSNLFNYIHYICVGNIVADPIQAKQKKSPTK